MLEYNEQISPVPWHSLMEIPQYLHHLSVEERQAWVPADVAGNAATSSDIDVHSVFDLKKHHQ